MGESRARPLYRLFAVKSDSTGGEVSAPMLAISPNCVARGGRRPGRVAGGRCRLCVAPPRVLESLRVADEVPLGVARRGEGARRARAGRAVRTRLRRLSRRGWRPP